MRRATFVSISLSIAFCVSAVVTPAKSQDGRYIPEALQNRGSEEVLKQRINNWTVGIAGGNMDGTYLRFADDLLKALDDGDEMRVIPMISRGAAANVLDLLYLRGVDIAFTQADVFEYFRTQHNIPNLEQRVQYIIRLPPAELHVIAQSNIQTLEDLRGQKVAFGPPGSAPSLTGPIVFQRLGIEVAPIYTDFPSSLAMLRSGEVAALLSVVPKPVELWQRIPANAGLHLVPVKFSEVFQDFYSIGELTSADYPNMVPEGQTIDTIAVPSVLAVYNWPKNTDRFRKVERFVQYLYARWDKLKQPPAHPKWRDVNLAATVPGWTRFSVSEEALQNVIGNGGTDQATMRDFKLFMATRKANNASPDNSELETLFRQFLLWRSREARP